jgi:hypothetical protein
LPDAWINARNYFYVGITNGLDALGAKCIGIPIDLLREWRRCGSNE